MVKKSRENGDIDIKKSSDAERFDLFSKRRREDAVSEKLMGVREADVGLREADGLKVSHSEGGVREESPSCWNFLEDSIQKHDPPSCQNSEVVMVWHTMFVFGGGNKGCLFIDLYAFHIEQYCTIFALVAHLRIVRRITLRILPTRRSYDLSHRRTIVALMESLWSTTLLIRDVTMLLQPN
eukprot:811712_1